MLKYQGYWPLFLIPLMVAEFFNVDITTFLQICFACELPVKIDEVMIPSLLCYNSPVSIQAYVLQGFTELSLLRASQTKQQTYSVLTHHREKYLMRNYILSVL